MLSAYDMLKSRGGIMSATPYSPKLPLVYLPHLSFTGCPAISGAIFICLQIGQYGSFLTLLIEVGYSTFNSLDGIKCEFWYYLWFMLHNFCTKVRKQLCKPLSENVKSNKYKSLPCWHLISYLNWFYWSILNEEWNSSA